MLFIISSFSRFPSTGAARLTGCVTRTLPPAGRSCRLPRTTSAVQQLQTPAVVRLAVYFGKCACLLSHWEPSQDKKQVLLTVEPDRVNKDCGTSTVYQCGSFCLEDAADLCQQRFCECDRAAIDCMTQSPYNSSLRGLADTSCSATNQTGETKRSRLQSQHLATVFGSFGCLVTSLMFYKEHIYSASFSVPETTVSFCTSALQARK